MTLAASFVLYGVPIIVADMLVSVNGPHVERQLLPSSGPLTNLPATKYGVHGLRQKIEIISDNCAVAFADSVSSAMVAISSLRRLAAKSPITVEVLQTFFDNDGFDALKNVALVGFVISPNGNGSFTATYINWRSELVDIGHLGTVSLAGTGGQLLEISEAAMAPFEPAPTGRSVGAAMTTALAICGSLLREEHATASTIAVESTGGSYEIAYFNGKRFIKEPEITFVSWDVELVGGEIKIDYPYLIIRQYYELENAIIDVARIELGKTASTPSYSLFTHAVPPAFKSSATGFKASKALLSFASRTTVHSILITNGSKCSTHSIVENGESGFDAQETAPGVFTHAASPVLLNSIRSIAAQAQLDHSD